MNKKHFISLLSYLGVGFIGGSISHGFFSGTRSVIMAILGFILFLLGELLNKDSERSWVNTIVFGLLYSLSIGMISGGFQHFLDSPERSLWIIPLGYVLSWIVFSIKNKRENFNRLSIIGGVSTTALLFGAARSALHYLPASVYSELADHHEHTNSDTGHTNADEHEHRDLNAHIRLGSGSDTKTTFSLSFNGIGSFASGANPFIANQDSIIKIYPRAIVGGDAVQAINDLQLVHEKYIHLIVVRKDGGGFLHLHPDSNDSGEREVKTSFPSGGEWYMYADIDSKEFGPQVITDSVKVEGPYTTFITNPISGTGVVINQSGYKFSVSWDQLSDISPTNFYVSVDSGSLEDYLGAKGHMVAINLSDMSYSHIHPIEEGSNNQKTSFMAHFESNGIYRVFIQVQINGEIFTLPLSIEVR